MYNYIINKKAFTLVELIVVITILSVLATIAFISFQGYGVSSRDSVRLADLSSISRSLNLVLTKGEKLPFPDDFIEIQVDGSILNYQGTAGETLLGKIGVHNGGIDPLEDKYYTLSINNRRNKYQLLSFLENGEDISKINNDRVYAGYENRFPKLKGSELGVVIDETTNNPANIIGNDIDIVNTSNSYTVFINNETEGITGSGDILEKKLDYILNKNGNCNSILKNGDSIGDGRYIINPTGSNELEVYCDMTGNGGGWTLVWHGLPTEARDNDTTNETLAISGDIKFNEIFADSVNTTDYHIENTSDTAVLSKSIREYFNEVTLIDNLLNPRVMFHNINGGQDITVENMMYGYGKIFRIFAIGRNTWTIDRIYVCNSYGATKFKVLSLNDKIELGGVNGGNCYFLEGARDNIIHSSETGLSMYKWQETKIYIR